ncbi:lysozyme inhibitor LprI family protein [Halobacillus ihumii]|uniref:lysozyme inhibitor LprI family protein n=1 Tax=Halobacillus ihumii TaxID=2686092 RepID=UPI0013CF8FD8|nr:lysozyme inhibitor LprI family protein [Halobacillus ihumii]
MKNNHKLFMVMLTVVIALLGACDNSDESSAESTNESPDSSTTQNENDDTTNKSSTDPDENKTDNPPEDTDDTQVNDQEATSENTNLNDEKSSTSNESNSEAAVLSKGEYLEKLNKMEEADRYAEVRETMSEMVAQEEERYQKWDEELNKIYGVLEEQLPPEQMDKLREKQRNWVEHRDEAAKEASLKYEGGSTEELEYVATQASLTRERCYELVARYME